MIHYLFVILQQTNYNRYMKKLVFALLLIAVSFNVMDAAILSSSRILFINSKIWDTTTRSVSFIPIDASVEDNRYIKVEFLDDESQSSTFQIKDNQGNIIYHETVIPKINTLYTIDLSEFKGGQYEFIYSDKDMEIVGEFTVNNIH